MIKKRIIPKLLLSSYKSWKGVRSALVVTQKFKDERYVGDARSQARIYEAQLADELLLVDIIGNVESWERMIATIKEISSDLSTPLVAGGGIRSFGQVQSLFDKGADKVVINSGIIERPDLVDRIVDRYGSQALVVGIDYRQDDELGARVVYKRAGKYTEKVVDAWAKELANRGAGEIMLTSVDRDGKGIGLDLEVCRRIAAIVHVPIIASGGCGRAEHFVEGFRAGASGVAAGTFFTMRDQNPMQCRAHVKNANIDIRMGY